MSFYYRSIDNTNRAKLHNLELLSNGDTDEVITYDGGKLPINLLDTFNLQFTKDSVKYKDEDGKYYDILHQNSQLNPIVEEEIEAEEVISKKVKSGNAVVSGGDLNIKQSPNPCCYIGKDGTLNSVVFANGIWKDSVMGYTGEGKPNSYSQGLIREGSSNHQGLFMRKDGNWGQPSIYTGSVSEHFLSLQDTPLTYQDNINKYLRVSYVEGGSVVFDSIDTSKVPEDTNLYYTEERVQSKITSQLGSGTITNLKVNGKIEANEFLADSDITLKKNIKNVKGALNIVTQLQPKTYRFKNDDSKERIGLISQEVKTILPNLVNTSGVTEKINYLELIPLLIGSIKELQEELEDLRYDLDSK
jgi:hypothetical protein